MNKAVVFPTNAPRLEGLLLLPEASRFPGVVVCHPHPLYGGDMYNPVVQAVASAVCQRGIATLCFNFRSVGESRGEFDDGRGEQDDVREAISFLSKVEGIDANRIGLAGYSFGGRVAIAACPHEPVSCLAAISPDIGDDAVLSFSCPALFAVGDEDQFVDRLMLSQKAKELGSRADLATFPGVDHFWYGSLNEMAGKVADFFEHFLKI